MNKLEDMTMHGEVVIVQRPHQLPCKVCSFASIDEAFKAFVADGIYTTWDSFSDFADNFAGDDDFINEVKVKLEMNGMDLNKPFAEFAISPNHEIEYLPMPIDKVSLLGEMVDYDMHCGHVFIAEGESYIDFIAEIYDRTRGHNEPHYKQITSALWMEDVE